MSQTEDREPAEAEVARGSDTSTDRRFGFRIAGGVLAGVLLLMLILLPWLEAWGFPRTRPEHVYRGLELLLPHKTGPSAYDVPLLNGAAPGLIVGYLILAAACLFFPATIVSVVSSFAGFAVTIALLLAVNSGEPHHRGASWTYSPVVAIVIWLVTAMVSVVGWSAPRRSS